MMRKKFLDYKIFLILIVLISLVYISWVQKPFYLRDSYKYRIGNAWQENGWNYRVENRIGLAYEIVGTPIPEGPSSVTFGKIGSDWTSSYGGPIDCVGVLKESIPKELDERIAECYER